MTSTEIVPSLAMSSGTIRRVKERAMVLEVPIPAYGSVVITVGVQVSANAPSGTLGVALV